LPSCSRSVNGPPLHSPSPADPTTSSPGISPASRAPERGQIQFWHRTTSRCS
jgi:hypothetical protein